MYVKLYTEKWALEGGGAGTYSARLGQSDQVGESVAVRVQWVSEEAPESLVAYLTLSEAVALQAVLAQVIQDAVDDGYDIW